MKDFFYWIILVVIGVSAGGFLYYKHLDTLPCTHPVEYSIGAVDPRFGTNASELTSDLAFGAAIWNKAAGKTLFTLVPSGGVKVNLIYDEREESAKLGLEIAKEQVTTDAMRATVDAEHAQVKSEQDALNAEISAINARGGATPADRTRITAEQQSLELRIETLNNDVASFNARIRALNAQVAEFNKTAGHLFKEGEYVQDASGKRINIFEFVGKNQLERVLAHELGHAVGLDHNDDPDSIMYANNESGNLIPTATDVSALKSLCGIS